MAAECRACKKQFQVTSRELAFLERVAPAIGNRPFALPPPSHCPPCRWQRRLAFRNERALFRRTCDFTGRSIVSIYPPGTKFPVYNILDWIGDAWDATSFGRPFDFSRPFFDQYKEMADNVPHFNLSISPDRDENAEFTNCATDSKNCYLISQAEWNEDCYYSRGINHCKNCSDCLRVDRCELCYEGINLSLCYRCLFCQDCDNCNECYFSTSLRGCKNCFGCHNLFQKQYYFFNEPLSRQDWEARFRAFQFSNKKIEELKDASEKLRLTTPHRFARVFQCEDASGDHLMNCLNAIECYDSRDLEHCMFVSEVQNGAKYCQDYSICGVDTELLYECVGCGYSAYHLLFCSAVWSNVAELLYCESCGPGVQHCFGCFGLRRKEYCVLNQQYTRAEYEQLISRVIAHMKDTGEWGEFFPPWVSADDYNNTIANDYFPLAREEVLQRGWNWYEEPEARTKVPAQEIKLPEMSVDTSDADLETALFCERTKKPFKIIRQELRLLQQLALPLPRFHPETRHADRVQRRNPRQLWKRLCANCSSSIDTTYAPDRPERVYCERCYLQSLS